MQLRLACLALVLALGACQPGAAPRAESADAPQLDTPAPESAPARRFVAAGEAARAATGDLSLTMSLRLPDAEHAGAAPQDVLTLSGANGLTLEAEVTNVVSPGTQVEGQTLRALLELPVEAAQVLVYRVARESKPQSGQGVCGAGDAAFVVVWEPEGPGETTLKLLGVSGGAPGAADARACPMLEYARQ